MLKKQLIIDAKAENLDAVTAFLESFLEEADCPVKVMMKITLALEEIFINVASYAYAPETGKAEITLRLEDNGCLEVSVKDRGRPYDPLSRQAPDLNAGAEDREIGGLGIFLTRKSMDDVRYVYRDGANILTMTKSIR